jgi:DNA-directed RNA polymerase specialized sigma24 family protein
MDFALLLGRICDARRMALEQTPPKDLLSLFDPEDSGRAEEKYRLFRSKLIWFFDRHNCSCPEDLADETLYRVVKSVSTGKEIYAQNKFAFFWAVANNVRREEWKRRKSEPLDNHPFLSSESSDLENRIYLTECVKASLSTEEEMLLRSYYLDGSEATAHRLGVTLPYLRLKIHQIRNKVRKFAAKQDRNA